MLGTYLGELPSGYNHWSDYNSLVYNTNVAKGGTSTQNIIDYITDQFDLAVSKVAVQRNRLMNISDPIIRQGLSNKLDAIQALINRVQSYIWGLTQASELRSAFTYINDVWTQLDVVIDGIQTIPGTVGLTVSPDQIRAQAMASMTAEQRDLFDSQNGDLYITQLLNQFYQEKAIDVMADTLGEEAVAPLRANVEANREILNNSAPNAIEVISNSNPAFSSALDEASEGGALWVFKTVGRGIKNSLPPLIGENLGKIMIAIAGLGALWVVRPYIGLLPRRRRVAANRPVRQNPELLIINPRIRR
jgi:hypothetical protein